MKPRTAQHRAKAEANAALARRLATEEPPCDWAVVVAFYAAVHYVGALLWERSEYEPHDHGERGRAINRMQELQQIEAVYFRLYDVGKKVRYLPGMKISAAPIEIALGDMAQIRTTILPLLDAL